MSEVTGHAVLGLFVGQLKTCGVIWRVNDTIELPPSSSIGVRVAHLWLSQRCMR
jgi:hypothetical protein